MWKTQHVVIIAVAATILSVSLTLYAQSSIQHAIASKAVELNAVGSSNEDVTKKKNPFQLMSALSRRKKKDDDVNDFSIPPHDVSVEDEVPEKRVNPKGSGVRWTPL